MILPQGVRIHGPPVRKKRRHRRKPRRRDTMESLEECRPTESPRDSVHSEFDYDDDKVSESGGGCSWCLPCCGIFFLLFVVAGVGLYFYTQDDGDQSPEPAEQQVEASMEKRVDVDAPQGNLSEGIDAPEKYTEEKDDAEVEDDKKEKVKVEDPGKWFENLGGMGKTTSYFIWLTPASLLLGCFVGPHYLCCSELMGYMPFSRVGASIAYFFACTFIVKSKGWFQEGIVKIPPSPKAKLPAVSTSTKKVPRKKVSVKKVPVKKSMAERLKSMVPGKKSPDTR